MKEANDLAGHMAVLVVDDEPLVRMFATDILLEASFKVFETSSAAEAIQALEVRSDIHAVLTDIEMPGEMNGLALAATIRERWPCIAVLVTSGREHLSAAELADGARFIPKPYAPSDLLIAIHSVISANQDYGDEPKVARLFPE